MKILNRLLLLFISLSILFSHAGCSGDSSFDNYFFVDINHIINSSVGLPYSVYFNEETGRFENTSGHIISATIISPSSFEGDAYSTAVTVMGTERATEFIEGKISEGKIQSAILFTADKKMLVFGEVFSFNQSNNFSEYQKYESTYGEFSTLSDPPSGIYPSGSYSRYTEYVFGAAFEFEIYIFNESIPKKNSIKDEIMLRVDEINRRVNVTLEDSDIYKINHADAGDIIEISLDTFTLLGESKRIYEETDGAFNIAVAPLSRLWNVDIDGIAKYSALGNKSNWTYPSSLPTLSQIETEKAKTDLNDLVLIDEDGRFFAKKENKDLELDLGGIAKGYAVDAARLILEEYDILSAQLNLSGNIYQFGNYLNPETDSISTWKIGVTNPENKHSLFKGYICAFESLGDCSIVTSGDYERFYSYGYD